MSAIVIDTNVLLVAERKAHQMSDACVETCIARLDKIRRGERVVLDDKWIIIGEYQNKLFPNESQSPGSAFLKWLMQVQGVELHVTFVSITPLNNEKTRFEEFPDDSELEAEFDPADRKFIAVANAHPEKPPVLESADSKWLGWESKLLRHGIRLEVLCRPELEQIRKRKTK